MIPPVRVQLSRSKGWRLPANTVKVDRSSKWGNFFRIGQPLDEGMARRWGHDPRHFRLRHHRCADAAEAVRRFAGVLAFDEAIWPALRAELRGKNLACWCALDQPCHADVLLDLANRT
jgi:hypothetical protein